MAGGSVVFSLFPIISRMLIFASPYILPIFFIFQNPIENTTKRKNKKTQGRRVGSMEERGLRCVLMVPLWKGEEYLSKNTSVGPREKKMKI
jgi:hypothetical protein